MGCLVLAAISFILSIFLTLSFFFGSKYDWQPLAFSFIVLFIGSSWLFPITWEEYFWGFNWIGNSEFWEWMTNPL